MNTYYVDFTELEGDGYIRIKTPREVSMIDREGNFCSGDVMGYEGGYMLVKPDFDTWVDAPEKYVEED